MLKWSLKGWSPMAFLFPTELGQKLAIYFIKRGLSILIRTPLYRVRHKDPPSVFFALCRPIKDDYKTISIIIQIAEC